MKNALKKNIFSIADPATFTQAAIDLFQYQYTNNALYRQFTDTLHVNYKEVKTLDQIPFLPINFFKTHTIITSGLNAEAIFTSSGTTGMQTSKHAVADLAIYEASYLTAFKKFYGDPTNYCILALLPSYIERGGSSLVYMVNDLIKKSHHPDSGFYLNNLDELSNKLLALEQKKQKTILIGVTYALLDLIAVKKFKLNHTIIMETGGMKGKRKELIREELHAILYDGFGVDAIHSEYGMTELLSQAYSFSNGTFRTPPWMKILIRDITDPLTYIKSGNTGGINVIDLANMHSCAFIATQDLGKMVSNSEFEILGRFDNSDLRGCNLLIQ